MVVVYDHTVQEHHFFSSGTLMALTCDLLGTKIGKKAQCVFVNNLRLRVLRWHFAAFMAALNVVVDTLSFSSPECRKTVQRLSRVRREP